MIALIPARGGSKGLPNKNIKELFGKPLISYSIEAALATTSISRVIVSTDSDEIAEIAKHAGAEVPFLRPDYLSSDNAEAVDAYIHLLDYLKTEEGLQLDELIILLPTCPLRSSQNIQEAIKLYKEKSADSVVSFTFEHHPVHWHAWHKPDLSIDFLFQHDNKNRQDLRKTIFPNGAIYIIKSDLLRNRNYYSDRSYAYIMEQENSVDIDTLFDFEWAEFLLKKKMNE